MTFPLCHRPGGIVFLDDDPDYLEMLAEVMPLDWYVRLFTSPISCINVLQQEPPRWEEDAWRQQEIVNQWHNGQPLIPLILDYWRKDGTTRFNLSTVCVVDYSMPAMSGLRFLSEVIDWTGSRVMLTGRADAQLGVSAFNRGLIDRFIPKQSPAIRLRLVDTIEHLCTQPNSRHHHIWNNTLAQEQTAILSVPSVDNDLTALSQKNRWIEHIVIGDPFGVIALTMKGQAMWVQFMSAEKLPEHAEAAAKAGLAPEVVSHIRAGRQLCSVALDRALGLEQTAQLQPAFSIGTPEMGLYAAAFPIDPSLCPGLTQSYEYFLNTAGDRDLVS